MKCKYCQYHTSDGRCLYYIGCPYKPSQNEPTENTFPLCKNCVYFDIPSAEEPCADCQIHFANDQSKPHFKSRIKPTNGDRIRAMTDEELADVLDHVQGDAFLVGIGQRENSVYPGAGISWLDWLKQEVDT